jgi:hypothetical protein
MIRIIITASLLAVIGTLALAAWRLGWPEPLRPSSQPSRIDRSGDPLLHLPERVLLEVPRPLALPKPERPTVVRWVARRRPPSPPQRPVEQPIIRVTTTLPEVPELPLYPER